MTAIAYLENVLTLPEKKEKNFAEIMIGIDLSDEIKKITDNLSESISFSDTSYTRLLSQDEIKDCETDMNVSFSNYSLFPLFDLGDNDYICYSYGKRNWCIFNIVDEIVFSQKTSILKYF